MTAEPSPTAHIQSRQTRRLQYIDLCAYVLGVVNRKLVMNRFDLKEAWVSRDIKMYQALTNERLTYDTRMKSYRPSTNFKPLYRHLTSTAIDLVAEGSQKMVCEPQLRANTSFYAIKGIEPELDVVAPVLRAVNLHRRVEITYRSRSSGLQTRAITPHGIIRSGTFDYVRGYDHLSACFKTFKLSRIVAATLLPETDEGNVGCEKDADWNETVAVTLKVHPDTPHKETIEFDYGFESSALVVNIQRVALYYFLADWNIAPEGYKNLPCELYPLVVESVVEVSP